MLRAFSIHIALLIYSITEKNMTQIRNRVLLEFTLDQRNDDVIGRMHKTLAGTANSNSALLQCFKIKLISGSAKM